MRTGLKMLLAGIIFGFMAVFAFIGVKSLINDQQKSQVRVQPPDIETSTILGQSAPAAGSTEGANPSLADQDATAVADDSKVRPTLVGEPDTPDTISEPENTASQTPPAAGADTGIDAGPAGTGSATDPAANTGNAVVNTDTDPVAGTTAASQDQTGS
ncbi:MAG TPA: hypothetical protein PLN94_11940, partial [Thiolinea sp.]|nr:hypothetical protein [Thiolinea sp.]